MGSTSILSTREDGELTRDGPFQFGYVMHWLSYIKTNEILLTRTLMNFRQARKLKVLTEAISFSTPSCYQIPGRGNSLSSESHHASVTTQRKLGTQAIFPNRALSPCEECPGVDSERNIYLSLFHPQRVAIEEKLILTELQ